MNEEDAAQIQRDIIARNIRIAQGGANMTGRDIAAKAGVSIKTFSFARRGRPVTLESLRKIADALDLTMSEIMGDNHGDK